MDPRSVKTPYHSNLPWKNRDSVSRALLSPTTGSKRIKKGAFAILISGALVAGTVADESGRSPTKRSVRHDHHLQDLDQRVRNMLTRSVRNIREVRSIDGTLNNLNNATWGAAGVPFLRLTTNEYGDGSNTPAGSDRPNAREVSNLCASTTDGAVNIMKATDYLWQWGQFLDHDITETPVADPSESFSISVPAGDPYFDPTGTGTVSIPLDRSFYEVIDGVREQVNVITAYIDASNVYGSDEERAHELRTMDGSGRLKTSDGDLLPYNVNGLPNAGGPAPTLFLAGDIRANEQAGLTAMHTLFVREHNHWAEAFREMDASLSGEDVYQMARAMVAAEMQAITYREFLPVLLGREGLKPYQGYRPQVNPGIANGFAASAYRVGHTMLSSTLLRLDGSGNEIAEGHISLAQAFFRPDQISRIGIDPYLRGLAAQACQEIDTLLIDDVRNFLFGPPGAGGFDLASLNIQRGRDHGIANYNQARVDYGLPPVTSWSDISIDPQAQANLAEAYGSLDKVDLWVGGLAEDHLPGAMVGETFARIIGDQFERLRDGDRFWYERYLPREIVDMVNQQTLATIIRRNTGIEDEIQDNVFRLPRDARPKQEQRDRRGTRDSSRTQRKRR